ncbi:hypothetical protein IE81DRAFT_229677 [Ceraceosorus guamensis]|uniref:Secreted protein n=1 Tax=Ceraceosorus guamensis TaxID=1522189 RepID=A0A316W618_9BASI|nr:hypothetical protein IE81DRAFT_229677 [Ceraceosorus guamensis]PWN45104.1 hypothetical protein IE81DRAFT_229677 [Ceraceosorus guamensis]
MGWPFVPCSLVLEGWWLLMAARSHQQGKVDLNRQAAADADLNARPCWHSRFELLRLKTRSFKILDHDSRLLETSADSMRLDSRRA